MMAQHPLVSNYDLSSLRRLVIAAAPVSAEIIQKGLERINNPNIIAKQGRLSSLVLLSLKCSEISVFIGVVIES